MKGSVWVDIGRSLLHLRYNCQNSAETRQNTTTHVPTAMPAAAPLVRCARPAAEAAGMGSGMIVGSESVEVGIEGEDRVGWVEITTFEFDVEPGLALVGLD